jgi:hypothetical protein
MRWEQISQDINREAAYDQSGASVSLSADGMAVAIGSPYNDENGTDSGQVRVYSIDGQGSSWERLSQVIYGDSAYDYFGISVNLSPDWNTLAIGSPGYYENNDQPGYVRVFTLEIDDNNVDTGSWKQIGRDITGEADGDEFGTSLSLFDDGKTLAVGARAADVDNGVDLDQVRVYRMDADFKSGWMQLGNNINGEAAYDGSGWSGSLLADGNTVANDTPYNDDNDDDNGGNFGQPSDHVRVFVLGG